MVDPIKAAARALAGRTNILVFTGAGISTESGIPDFRGPQGLWTKIDPEEFDIDRYRSNKETRRASWRMRIGSGVVGARPNAGHHAVASLWRGGRMVGCVTQNVDGLHQRAGLPSEAVVELHGNVSETVCLDCGARYPTLDVIRRVDAGEDDPQCTACGGVLKVGVVMFGEYLPTRELERAADMVAGADAVVAVGSTLSVSPAAGIPLGVVARGKPMVIINTGATDLDDLADVVIPEQAGSALPRLVSALGVPLTGDYHTK